MTQAPNDPVADRVMDALLANTEAMTHLNATVSSLQQDYAAARKNSREFANNQAAKVDNLDRTVREIGLATEKAEAARSEELRRIFDLLVEERKDRRAAIVGERDIDRKSRVFEREIIQEIIQEELGRRRDTKNLVVNAGREVWRVGGRYIVAALAVIIAAAVLKVAGISLADIIGLAGK